MITPQIITLSEKKLVGLNLSMSLSSNKTAELWKSFIPRCKEIENRITSDLISMQVYPDAHFTNFSPHNLFIKWATAEVADFANIPEGMQPFTLATGLYAVFHYQGLSTDNTIFRTIFETWLPNSEYILDNRPHFEILGEKYKNNDPASEEEIWIPIALK